jgi:protein O-GlcNAc transferase
VLADFPNQFDALLNLGRIFLRRGHPPDAERAIDLLRRAVAANPGVPEASFELANALHRQNRFDDAANSYRQVLRLRPDYAEARNNLGRVLHALGRWNEAAANYVLAISLKPDFAAAHYNLGNVLRAGLRFDRAVASYRRALAIEPDNAAVHCSLAETLLDQGRTDAAIGHFDRALTINPEMSEARFGRCMAQLPVLYRDEGEIAARRNAYAQCLGRLCDEVGRGRVADDLADGFGANQPFFLAYQGRNDRDLQRRYGALACRAMVARYPTPRLPPPATPREKVRVGIVSGFFRNHSNWKIPIKGWLGELDRAKFRVFGYHTGNRPDRETEIAAARCERFVQGPLPLARWRAEILADAPHVLVYPEIGMDTPAARLAAQRLAPVQCVSWGHPDTSGFPTIDYFLSSALMEPPDAQDHYTERLIRLPNLSIYYDPPEFQPVALDRDELGLRSAATVFWSGQSLFKYLPQFDQVFSRIARQVGDCQFVFIDLDKSPDVSALFRRRLERAFAEFDLRAADYCVMLPRLGSSRFVSAIGQCDIVLDSLGWSGCNSTLEGLAHDLPIVTLRGDLMRGRHTMAILEMMGVTETIADTVDEYISLAVHLARDPGWRNVVRRRIAENKHRVYRDRECIAALEEFFCRVARGEAIGDATESVPRPAASGA